MTGQGVRHMLGRENTGAVTGPGEVDTDFWALVLQDEQWLRAEFDAIVSEPCETRSRPSAKPTMTGAARPDGVAPWQHRTFGTTRPWRAGNPPGRRRRRERSPPP
jgi:hypothetical protein